MRRGQHHDMELHDGVERQPVLLHRLEDDIAVSTQFIGSVLERPPVLLHRGEHEARSAFSGAAAYSSAWPMTFLRASGFL